MSRRVLAALPWLLAAVSVAFAGWSLVLIWLVRPLALPEGMRAPEADLPFLLAPLAGLVVGALVASRRPRNPIGWLFCLAGLAGSFESLAYAHLAYALAAAPAALPLATSVAWLASLAMGGLLFGAFPIVFLLFPDGRLASSRWRPVLWLAFVGVALWIIRAFAPGPMPGIPFMDNPLALEVIPGDLFVGLPTVFMGALVLMALASLVVRMRRSRDVERQQFKWLSISAALLVLAVVATILVEGILDIGEQVQAVMDVLWLLAATSIPVSMGVAILRYRLYDIDLIINRALVYGALTATLALAYWGLVVLMQLLLRPFTEGSELAIIGSTLAVAALFRPARRSIQELVDRRFYRQKYDAARTLEAFSLRLRQQTDLDSLSRELLGVVQHTLQPTRVSLWLRPGEGRR